MAQHPSRIRERCGHGHRFGETAGRIRGFIVSSETINPYRWRSGLVGGNHVAAARRRNPLKFVLIGIGPNVNEEQMEELDDLETGTSIDLWDHKLAAGMRLLQEIFAEVVDRNARIADNGRILDAHGRTIKDYSDTGMSAYLEFEMPADSEYFTLEVNGSKIHQGLSDHARVPPPQLANG